MTFPSSDSELFLGWGHTSPYHIKKKFIKKVNDFLPVPPFGGFVVVLTPKAWEQNESRHSDKFPAKIKINYDKNRLYDLNIKKFNTNNFKTSQIHSHCHCTSNGIHFEICEMSSNK